MIATFGLLVADVQGCRQKFEISGEIVMVLPFYVIFDAAGASPKIARPGSCPLRYHLPLDSAGDSNTKNFPNIEFERAKLPK